MLQSATAIEDALGIDDIRKFDNFLRNISGNTCSLLVKRAKKV
jgi:hypothetical protein